MEFAKLFTFATGQLLVERKWEAFGTSSGYPCLVTQTQYQPEGPDAAPVTATSKTVFPTVEERDADFNSFGQARAEKVFESHQEYLKSGAKLSFSTDQEPAFVRLNAAQQQAQQAL